MPIPEKSLSDMYPGRFLEAADLKGNTVTVKIAAISADLLETEKDGKKRAYILSFSGKKKGLLLNKTNAFLLRAMFGDNANQWEGKRVAIYPTTTKFGPETVPCIRVYGSPDIPNDVKFEGKIGWKKVRATLHALKAGEKHETAPDVEETELDPSEDIVQAWSFMGWTRAEGLADMRAYSGDDYLAHVNSLIDQKNAEGGE